MEFIVNVENTSLTPEKMPELYYNGNIGEFVLVCNSTHELHTFGVTYGQFLFIPGEEDYELPTLLFGVID